MESGRGNQCIRVTLSVRRIELHMGTEHATTLGIQETLLDEEQQTHDDRSRVYAKI
jgi:hypothetical protein